MKTFAIVLIILGIAMIIFNQVSYTKKEKVIDVGAIEVNKNERKEIAWPLYAGILVSATGVVMLMASRKRTN